MLAPTLRAPADVLDRVSRVKRQQLEVLAVATIERARSGGAVEDDRVELKREWPGVDRVRQLAGSANRLNGEFLVYLIGVDEKGEVFPTDQIDPADWWATMRARFDDVFPDLVTHATVTLEDGTSVVALAFSTDAAPYLVKNAAGGSPELEVPLRTATGTRSASRSALLRILVPSVEIPRATLLSATAWSSAPRSSDYSGPFRIEVRTTVFFEASPAYAVFLPAHDVVTQVILGDVGMSLNYNGETNTDLRFRRAGDPYPPTPVPPQFGVHVRTDGIVITGPGSVRLSFGVQVSELSWTAAQTLAGIPVEISFGVAGSDRTAEAAGLLLATPRKDEDPEGEVKWEHNRPRRASKFED